MPNEERTVLYDAQLQIEAYRFQGLLQRFPNHFHDYYVILTIEAGNRHLVCKQREYTTSPGDMVLFNPGDVHACEPLDARPLDYKSINIRPEVMQKTVGEITGTAFLPTFTQTVLYRSELTACLGELHRLICAGETDFVKEERYLFLIGQLVSEYAGAAPDAASDARSDEFEAVCAYLDEHYDRPVSLDTLCALVTMSKYHFIRSFTKHKGISPYSYLQTVRITRAKKLLEQGTPPVQTALLTGFVDQSHFTNCFKRLIGLTPRQYMRIFHNDETKIFVRDGDKNALQPRIDQSGRAGF